MYLCWNLVVPQFGKQRLDKVISTMPEVCVMDGAQFRSIIITRCLLNKKTLTVVAVRVFFLGKMLSAYQNYKIGVHFPDVLFDIGWEKNRNDR